MEGGTDLAQDEGHLQGAEGTKKGSSVATALRQSQGRKRTGSLRQAAMAKMRERSSSLRKERSAVEPTITATTSATSPNDEATPHQFSYKNTLLYSSAKSVERPTAQLLASPGTITSPVEQYTSTTDEDENTSFYRSSATSSSSSHAPPQGPVMSQSHRRAIHSEQRISATMDDPSPDLELDSDIDDEWDYSETEWWGWVVLLVTWIVFVVGMGSCFGVWSWAWDVGETPYAPPELEDDATLPITGYYPALMVCTAVMSWVWVVVAWVGMKYFRHAKVVGEEI